MNDFTPFESKMRSAGMSPACIASFRRNYESLLRNESGLLPEETITPVERIPRIGESPISESEARALLSKSVVIKLNGGLGTGMGLQGPKSLLTVRPGVTFLDLIVRQIRSLRQRQEVSVRLLLMNSFSTTEETMAHLARYHEEGFDDRSRTELMQNRVPKIDARSLEPVTWNEDPSLEWCPPGHGDLYPALAGSGWLDRLLEEGVTYAFVSNSDNLGASLDPAILHHFDTSGSPFLMEVTRRTESDSKGGHLAIRKSDGRLLLREVAQCPAEDRASFQDITRHRYFNTNNLWIRLDLLKVQLEAEGGSLPLPMIRNTKTVDPRDKNSPSVIQLETAMGAAIECFPGASAIEVPRSRFAPVKTTSDLLALRSDAYRISEDARVFLDGARNGIPPKISLSGDYCLIEELDHLDTPSLIGCRSLTVTGSFECHPGVVIRGDVVLENRSPARQILPPGLYENDTYVFGS